MKKTRFYLRIIGISALLLFVILSNKGNLGNIFSQYGGLLVWFVWFIFFCVLAREVLYYLVRYIVKIAMDKYYEELEDREETI